MQFKFGFVGQEAEVDNMMLNAFRDAGGERTNNSDWDVLWYTGKQPPLRLFKNLAKGQKVNHIPNLNFLTDKWLLAKDLVDTDIHPRTWLLDESRAELESMLTESDEQWILKPRMGTWGQDISLIDGLDELPARGSWLVQEKIPSYLVDGAAIKFRCYLLVTNCRPLTAFLYQDGLVDVAVMPEAENPVDTFAFNVNRGVQSKHPGFKVGEHHLSASQFRGMLDPVLSEQLWPKIGSQVSRLLENKRLHFEEISETLLRYPDSCFEFLGLDVMLDRQGHPWIIECNLSPSMDDGGMGEFKQQVLTDTFSLVASDGQQLGAYERLSV